MKLVGYFGPSDLEYGFGLPVFEEAGAYFFQTLANGVIQGFEPAEDTAAGLSMIPIELRRVVGMGDLPLYVYLKQGAEAIVGTKAEIDIELLSQVRWISVPLFSKLEMTIFLQDPTLFKFYSDRVQSKLHRQYPDYKGTITVEGLNSTESTHDIRIESNAPENNLLAIKLRLPEADATLRALMVGSRSTVRTMVISLGGSEAMAEDILQDAFSAFLDLVDAGKFRSEAKMSTMIFAIAKNKAISALRRSQSSPFAHPEQEEHDEQVAELETPESELIMRERILLVRELIAGLETDPSGCTKLLLARYQDDLQSNEALAKAFGFKNASVVSARLHNCKRSIMKRIAMDPVLLGKAMDFLNAAHELQPLIEQYSTQLPTIFAYLQRSLNPTQENELQKQMETDASLQHLVQAMQANFGH